MEGGFISKPSRRPFDFAQGDTSKVNKTLRRCEKKTAPPIAIGSALAVDFPTNSSPSNPPQYQYPLCL